MREVPLYSVGHWQTFTPLEFVTESVSVTATHATETLLTAFLSRGFVTSDSHLAAATSMIGSLPFGQSVSLPPMASGHLLVLPSGLPADGTPTMQAQHLLVLAQRL